MYCNISSCKLKRSCSFLFIPSVTLIHSVPAIFPAPKEILHELGWKIGDNCIIGVDGNKIVIIKENEPEIE